MSRQVRMSEAWRPGKVNIHRAGKRLAAAPAERLPGLYDPGQRAQLVRRRLHRQPPQGEVAPYRRGRPAHSREPRAPRRRRRRPADGRRRRHHGADPARVLRREAASGSASPCRRRATTRQPHLHAAATRRCARQDRSRRRGDHRATRARASRLARRARRQCLSVARAVIAVEPCHRQVFIGRGPEVPDEEDSSGASISCARSSRRAFSRNSADSRRFLRRLDVLPDDRLQGHVPVLPARRLLRRPARRAVPARRSPSSTSASRPTPFRPGVSPIPTGWWRTTARSTPCAATSTGWRRARPASIPSFSATTSRSSGRFPMKASRTPPASTTRSSS